MKSALSWNLKQLREDVERLYGRDRVNQLSPCLESVIERAFYARYHYQEFQRLLKDYLSKHSSDSELFNAVFGSFESEDLFQEVSGQVQANIVACTQSLHAMADTFGHVVYYALNLEGDPSSRLSPRDITIFRVIKSIAKFSDADEVRAELSSIVEEGSFQYLSDLVNHSKHRSLIGTSFTINMTGDGRAHGFAIKEFNYEGRSHSSRWVDDFIKAEYERLNLKTYALGNAINRLVATRA